MKVKVVNDFIDKHTKNRCNCGDVLEVSDDRYAEITAAGQFVVPVQEPAAPADDPAEAPDSAAEVQSEVEQVEQPAEDAQPPKRGRRQSRK